MAKRVLIIYRVDESNVSNKGIIKKLDGQANGFCNNDWTVDTIRISKGNIMLNEVPIKQVSKSKFGSVLFEFFQSIEKEIDFFKYDMLYIRYGLSFAGFVSFLKKAKEKNKNLKTVIEFATYPYTDEWTGTKGLVVKKVDSYYRNRLRRHVDYVIHLGEEKEILGMPCINSENGIDLTDIKVRNKKNDADQVSLIAVGKWQFWHGLDRVIRGIANSDASVRSKVNLVIVGQGPANESLESLVKQKGLRDQVVFAGEKTGVELDELFDLADVGIGTLGMHRKGIAIDSSLKHREYASRGLPFILCTKDLDFPRTEVFVKYYSESEDPIDVTSIVEFATEMKTVEPKEIRSFAKTKLSWEAKIYRILEQISFD